MLLVYSMACYIAIGYWLVIYDPLDSAHTRVVLTATFHQCALPAICLVIGQFVFRIDLSRPFVALFAVYSWILFCLFRLQAGHSIGAIRRRFHTAHYLMVVG